MTSNPPELKLVLRALDTVAGHARMIREEATLLLSETGVPERDYEKFEHGRAAACDEILRLIATMKATLT